MRSKGQADRTAGFFTNEQRQAQGRFADPARATRIVGAMPDTKRLSTGIIRVESSTTLFYPEFPGNDLMLSVGNLTAHPHIGLLCLSFDRRRRLKINGRVEILAQNDCSFADQWPDARLIVRVDIDQVLWNCSRRIPRLLPADA
jgi:hypothetical protein